MDFSRAFRRRCTSAIVAEGLFFFIVWWIFFINAEQLNFLAVLRVAEGISINGFGKKLKAQVPPPKSP